MTPEIRAKIDALRTKARNGELTLADVSEAVKMYRETRGIVLTAAEEKIKKSRAKKPKVDPQALLDGFLKPQEEDHDR